MVPPQSRFPVNQHRVVGLTVVVAAATAVLVLTLGLVLPRPVKHVFDVLRGYPAWSRRAALGPEAPPFGRLAASQVGYGPFMLKQFSSPRADQNRNPEA
jgi:hypothetical protein